MLKEATVIGDSDLAKRISSRIKASYLKIETRVFPDGESKITFTGKPKHKKLIVVYSTHPPVDTNFIRLLSIISKAKEFSSDITVITPYLGYARQDREFLPGEVITMKVMAKLFKAVGVKKLIVVDVHSMIGLKHFKFPTKNISAIPELVKFTKKLKIKNPLVISPDAGGKDRAKDFAKLLGTEFIFLDKKRDRNTGQVKIVSKNISIVKDRNLILVDDMISTGGSIIKASKFLKTQKCKRIFVACTHALLINNAERQIKKAGVTKIISTNTVPGKTSTVDVSGIIAKLLI